VSSSGGLDLLNVKFGVLLSVDWNRRIWLHFCGELHIEGWVLWKVYSSCYLALFSVAVHVTKIAQENLELSQSNVIHFEQYLYH